MARLPVSTLLYAADEKTRPPPFDAVWLFTPAFVGTMWLSKITHATTSADIGVTLDSQVRFLSEGARESPWTGQEYKPSFTEHYFSSAAGAALLPGLRHFKFSDGLDIAQNAKLPSDAVTIWHLIGSFPDSTVKGGKIPVAGLSNSSICTLIANFLFILELIFEDPQRYPDLPELHTSPFTVASPLCGCLLHLIEHLYAQRTRLAWIQTYEQSGTQKQTVAVLHHIGRLIRIFMDWDATEVYKATQCYRATATWLPIPQPPLHALVRGSTKKGLIADQLESWITDLRKWFSSETIRDPPTNTEAYLRTAPSFLLEGEPQDKQSPPKHPAQKQGSSGTTNISDQTKKKGSDTKSRKSEPAKHPPSSTTLPPAHVDDSSKGKQPEPSVSAKTHLLALRNKTKKPIWGAVLKAWKEGGPDRSFPDVRAKMVCLNFATEHYGCSGRQQKPKNQRKCGMIHIDLAEDDKHWTPADLRLLWEWTKKEGISDIVEPTAAFSRFMA